MVNLNADQLAAIKADAENGYGAGVGDTLRMVAELSAIKGWGEAAFEALQHAVVYLARSPMEAIHAGSALHKLMVQALSGKCLSVRPYTHPPVVAEAEAVREGSNRRPPWPHILIGMPAALHPDTQKLLERFTHSLAVKLRAAEQKYGYSNDWKDPAWMDECRRKLTEHAAKGDPRDVAAYCAFLWHHGESTAPPASGAVPVHLRGLLERVADFAPGHPIFDELRALLAKGAV